MLTSVPQANASTRQDAVVAAMPHAAGTSRMPPSNDAAMPRPMGPNAAIAARTISGTRARNTNRSSRPKVSSIQNCRARATAGPRSAATADGLLTGGKSALTATSRAPAKPAPNAIEVRRAMNRRGPAQRVRTVVPTPREEEHHECRERPFGDRRRRRHDEQPGRLMRIPYRERAQHRQRAQVLDRVGHHGEHRAPFGSS